MHSKNVEFFSPQADRIENRLHKRLRKANHKAYDRYKQEQEEREARNLRDFVESDSRSAVALSKKDTWDIDEDDDSRFYSGKHFSKFGRCWRKFANPGGKYELKWKEFFCLTFCLQVPLAYIVRHVSIVKKWGSLIVLGVYVWTVITIAVPIYMVYMFLGNYSRRSYIKFWECVPLLKGVAYSVAITSIMMEICNVSLAGLALLYLKDVVVNVEIPWLDCNFQNADPECIPLTGKQRGYNKTCCKENSDNENCTWTMRMESVIKYSTFDYYYNHKLMRGYKSEPTADFFNWRWTLVVEVIWMLIFLLMMMGLRRFRGFMTTINLIIFTVFIPVGLYTLAISPQHSVVDAVITNYSNIFSFKFWSETGVHTLHRELPGDIITFSSVSSPGISTTVDTVTVYVTKLFFIILLTVWLSISVRMLKNNYNMKMTRCVQIDGDVLFFAIIPDLITRMSWAKLWLVIYFAVIFFWGFSTAVYVMNSFLEAFLEEFPVLKRWRPFICLLICLTTGTGNAFMVGPTYMYIYTTFLESTYVQLRVTLLLFSMLGLLFYSIERFKADYHFTYGTTLGSYWINGIKVSILLVGVLFSIVYLQFSQDRIEDYHYFIYILTLSPVFIGMIIVVIKYSLKLTKNLITPHPRWGPPGQKKKLARQKFDPTHHLRYRASVQKCKHDCLVNSTTLEREIEQCHNKKYKFLDSSYRERQPDL